MCHSSNIWERQCQIKVWYRRKLGADRVRVMLATVQSRTFFSFCLLPKNIRLRIYKSIIFPVDLCGCDIWSLTLREEHRLMLFENRVLRRIFGPKRSSDRRLYKTAQWGASPSMYNQNDKSRRMRWAWHVSGRGWRGIHVGYWWESQNEGDH
jgi:hypothetical protein